MYRIPGGDLSLSEGPVKEYNEFNGNIIGAAEGNDRWSFLE